MTDKEVQTAQRAEQQSDKTALANAINFRKRLQAHERNMLQYWRLRAAYLRKRTHLMNQ